MPYTHRATVTAGDLDRQGHLASHAILRIVDEARTAFLEDVLGAADDAALGIIFAEAHLSFRAPVREGDEISVACTVGDVRRSSFRVWFEMRAAQRLAAEGYGVLVGYDYEAGRSAALRDDVGRRLSEDATLPGD